MLNKLKALLGLVTDDRPSAIAQLSPKPQHVAVIMDGNGRWANAKGLTRVAGHKHGVDSVKGLIKSCIKHEIPYLSIFAFSSENWNRPQSEVEALMDLLVNALETQTKKLDENGVRLQLLGDLSRFDQRIRNLAVGALSETASNDKLVLNVAINYGGRWDIAQACKKLARKVARGEIDAEQVDEDAINKELSTAGMPDPDLFIRTSGEYRISNFLLWQAAYSEFYFTDVLWPDFDEEAFTEALVKYARRDRRFGNVVDNFKDAQTVESKDKATLTSSNGAKSGQKSDQEAGAKHA